MARAICGLRLFSGLAFLGSCSRTSGGKPGCLRRAKAKSSVRAGSAAMRSRSADAGGAVSPAEISSLDISLSDVTMFSLRQMGASPVSTFVLLWLARLRRDRLDPGARRCRQSSSARYCRKPGAHLETDERHSPSLLLGASLLVALPLQHEALDDGRRGPRGPPTVLQLR